MSDFMTCRHSYATKVNCTENKKSFCQLNIGIFLPGSLDYFDLRNSSVKTVTYLGKSLWNNGGCNRPAATPITMETSQNTNVSRVLLDIFSR